MRFHLLQQRKHRHGGMALIGALVALGLTSAQGQWKRVPWERLYTRLAPAPETQVFVAQYVPYEDWSVKWPAGKQVWPLAREACVPIYFSKPPRDFYAMGYVVIWGERQDMKMSPLGLKSAARTAQAHHADALWVRTPQPGQY